VGFGAPEEELDAGDEFARAEGLGDVVVGAGFEGGDQVGFAAARGEHDDGEAMKERVLADFGEKLEAGEAGEHGVEEEEIGNGLREGGAAGEAVRGIGYVETGILQFVANEYNDIGVVLDDENAFHREPCVGKQWGDCTAGRETEGIKINGEGSERAGFAVKSGGELRGRREEEGKRA